MPPSSHARLHRAAGDALLAVAVLALALAPFPDAAFRATGWVVVPALAVAALLPLRHRFPVVATALALGCYAAAALAGVLVLSIVVVIAAGVYAITVGTRRRWGIALAAASVSTVFLLSAVALGDPFDARAMQFVAIVALVAAIGDAVRSRRAVVAQVTERADRTLREREAQAERRLVEERLRIARDLHDVLAHQISVISLNAGVASSAWDADPERARSALATIRQSSRSVLADSGRLIAVLRGADAAARTLAPQPGLAQLPDLISDVADAGLRVSTTEPPTMPALSPVVDHLAYRAAQEALTNALKHGGGTATLELSASDSRVTIAVANPRGDRTPAFPGGHGLVGLRERVHAIGGTVEVDDGPDTFGLIVRLPHDGERA